MNRVIGWRCWFDDGGVFSSKDWDFEELPSDGLLVRIIYYESGKQIQQGNNFYYEAPHPKGIIRGASDHMDEIEKRYPQATVIRGRWAPDEFYQEVVRTAMNSTWE